VSRSGIYLVDASIYIFRACFSLPGNWRARNGFPTQAVYGYTGFLLGLIERYAPAHVIAAFDESLGTCFRNSIYPAYKSRRVLPDEALAFQFEACKRVGELLGISTLASPRFEADDLIATVARQARESGMAAVVLSADKDLGQLLIGDADLLWDFPRADPLDRRSYIARYGIRPEQLPDFLALVGDATDDVPGVPGIGPKTAVSLLQEYPDAGAILADLPGVASSRRRGAARLAASLGSYGDQIRMVRRLTALADDAFSDRDVSAWERRDADVGGLRAFAEFHGLGGGVRERLERVIDRGREAPARAVRRAGK